MLGQVVDIPLALEHFVEGVEDQHALSDLLMVLGCNLAIRRSIERKVSRGAKVFLHRLLV